MKINVLDKKVYNRIAAGEVVERPFSVVKELVENSIDAGAGNIKISIWNGGKDRVEIEDDGCGIEKSELFKALLPHATSKIADICDLDNIMTLGFRGEALASIASVAKVKIVSRPAEQEFGASIFAEGGAIGKAEDAPSEKGTKITVDSLFYNTPVRAKFLKTTRAEEGDITNIVSRLILANPAISFTYYADDKLILQSYGGGDEEALISVYGIGAVRNCFRIETEKN
ncbi:MAG: ATP-binding protein, partial [Clostridia bacterium]|nr:ATP-binding protein [Clostridia bacterium]